MQLRLHSPSSGLVLAILAAAGAVAAISVAQEKPNKDAPSSAVPSSVAVPPAGGNRYALLVGCTKYNNKSFHDLEGPANDIPLMRKLLVEKFKFLPGNITELSENAAQQRGPNYRPTRTNIEREFTGLPGKVQKGDYVVVLLSGHGSQEPETDQQDLRYAKPNGYDSIFLPEDIGRWYSRDHAVQNAIADYRLRTWTKSITKTGASLWIIVDACCSGYTLRAGGAVARKVEPEQLGIPDEELQKANQRASRRGESRGSAQENSAFNLDDQSPNFVGLYAAQPNEPTVELPLPEGSKVKAKVYGLLTYSVCEILSKSANNVSYADLHRLICSGYDQMGLHSGPRPWIEGLAQEREVLGVATPGRSRWTLAQRNDKSWAVNAGKLLGLTDNSILAVYPPPNEKDADKPLGHVQVTESRMLESDVSAWDYDKKMPAASKDYLKPGLRCEPVFIDFGSMRLSIAVDTGNAKSKALQGQLEKIKKALGDVVQTPQLFDVVDNVNGAQWVLQERVGKILLLDGHSAQISDDSPLPTGTPVFEIPADGKNDPIVVLQQYLRQIFRGQNLLALTKPTIRVDRRPRKPDELTVDSSAIDVEVQMLKFKNVEDETGTPLPSPGGELVVTPGQIIGWQVINHSRFDVDVTLLFVGTDFQVKPVFPSRPGGDFDNWLPLLGRRIVAKSLVTDKPLGDERMIVIGVPHKSPANNFAFLALATANEARGSRGSDSALNSPLGELCQYALYGEGGTRGMEFGLTASYKTDLLEWRVLPAKTAKGAKQ